MRLPGYVEFVHDDLRFHILYRGEEIGGAFGMIYCPICGGLAGECNCQPYNLEKCKQELEDAKKNEFCDWCQGSASDLVYNLDDMEWGGEIDGETGWMTTFHNKIGTIGSRQVRFCPMCGRAVGRASKRD